MSQSAEPTSPSVLAEPEPPPLPGFILSGEDGLRVDLAALSGKNDFRQFVERLFGAGFLLRGLRYPLFQRLAVDWEPAPDADPEPLAEAIEPFDPARRELYKGVKISGNGEKAEYLFEAVSQEITERAPILGPPGEDGTPTITGWEERREARPTELDPDEFVADMWSKGLRYGIDYERVRKIIAGKETGRFEIATMKPPEDGVDAGIKEVFAGLHRDDSPRRMANGRFDLRQFTNRFPQIAKDVAILRKTPRTPGKAGYRVTGEEVEPSHKPNDFNLADLAGTGTKVERREHGEYIVATLDGFLFLDSQTNQVSVTEKVIHKDDISLRTTGDLSLAGDEFESHGDVQERRVVEGKHMHFRGDVYGSVLSRGGDIRIDGNIVKGKASSPGGSIVVQGRASQAELSAVGGSIELTHAEGCVLVATRVKVENAYNCEIIAERLEAGNLEGCAIAGVDVFIGRAGNRRDAETAVSVLIPDFSELRAREKQLADELENQRARLAKISAEIAQYRGQPELAKYIALDMKLKKGEIKLSAQQSEQVHKAAQRFVPIIRKIRELSSELEQIRQQSGEKEAELQACRQQRTELAAAVRCRVEQASGDTVARTLPLIPSESTLSDAQIAAIRAHLRQPDSHQTKLFSGSREGFEWRYSQPE